MTLYKNFANHKILPDIAEPDWRIRASPQRWKSPTNLAMTMMLLAVLKAVVSRFFQAPANTEYTTLLKFEITKSCKTSLNQTGRLLKFRASPQSWKVTHQFSYDDDEPCRVESSCVALLSSSRHFRERNSLRKSQILTRHRGTRLVDV